MENGLIDKLSIHFAKKFLDRLASPKYSQDFDIYIYNAEQKILSEIACKMQKFFYSNKHESINIYFSKDKPDGKYSLDIGWFLDKQKENSGRVVLDKMDSNLISLVDAAILIYSADKFGEGMIGVYEWARGNPSEEKKYIYNWLCKLNASPSKSRFSIDDFLREIMIKELSVMN